MRTALHSRAAVDGGRKTVIGFKASDHELAWIAAHKAPGQSPGQYMAGLLAAEQARVAAEEHRASYNPDGDERLD